MVPASTIFFLIDFIYRPFFVLLRAMITFFSLAPSVLGVGFGSVQTYWIHYKNAKFVLGFKVGCDLKVNGRFSTRFGLKL